MEPTRKIEKVSMRNLRMEDYDQLAKSFKRIYADSDVFWTKEQIKKLITIFPEGQVVISLTIRLWAVRSPSLSTIIW